MPSSHSSFCDFAVDTFQHSHSYIFHFIPSLSNLGAPILTTQFLCSSSMLWMLSIWRFGVFISIKVSWSCSLLEPESSKSYNEHLGEWRPVSFPHSTDSADFVISFIKAELRMFISLRLGIQTLDNISTDSMLLEYSLRSIREGKWMWLMSLRMLGHGFPFGKKFWSFLKI